MKLINAESVALKLGVSATTVYNLQRRDPTFPKAVRLSKRATRWNEEDIENWVNSKNGEKDEAGRTD